MTEFKQHDNITQMCDIPEQFSKNRDCCADGLQFMSSAIAMLVKHAHDEEVSMNNDGVMSGSKYREDHGRIIDLLSIKLAMFCELSSGDCHDIAEYAQTLLLEHLDKHSFSKSTAMPDVNQKPTKFLIASCADTEHSMLCKSFDNALPCDCGAVEFTIGPGISPRQQKITKQHDRETPRLDLALIASKYGKTTLLDATGGAVVFGCDVPTEVELF